MNSENQNKTRKRVMSSTGLPLTEIGKLPPQAIDLEEAVLGAMLLEKEALSTVIDILSANAFYKEQNGKVFSAIVGLFNRSEPVDILTVTQELKRTGELEFVGGAYYVSSLTNRIASSINIEFHARIVAQKFLQRELIRISNDTIRTAFEDSTDVFELLDETTKNIFEILDSNVRKQHDKMSTLITKAIEEIESAANKADGLLGVPSGFTALDRITGGWQKSDLLILAARPGMGKCLGKGTKVLMFDGSLKKVEDIVAGELLMGDDSTPRKVISIARGQEKMYWIRQNKSKDYRVNESHILSLKRSRNEGGHKKGEVLNITVKDYLEKSEKFKSNYKGYKVAIEFTEKETTLQPYYLGLWLGDGHSYSQRITNVDKEVIEYLEEYADELELEFVEYQQENKTPNYSIVSKNSLKKNGIGLQEELRKLNLIENKHIPQEYLINSTQKRLELLAGIIDADGYYTSEFNCFEIVQSNKKLAKQIKFLCDSLGFRTSLKKKKAVITAIQYEGEAYRVRIFGNLDSIPTKIERKKARAWNSKVDWRVTGISVEYDKVDDYYGFEIDGNRLFLLEDMTVTHNTAFVVTMAKNAAVEFNKPVAIFSLEMSSLQLVKRLISSETEISQDKILKGNLENHEFVQLNERIKKLAVAPLFIDDTPALSIFELRAKARRLKENQKVELIIIDYLQLMSGGPDSKGNREQEISNISRGLKSLAKELEIPIIALSQLSRQVENRPGGSKRPQLSDLRESGAIEQDADMVMFIYRPEYYGLEVDENNEPTKGRGEIIIAKNRHGALETVKLRFIGQFAKFADLDYIEGQDASYGSNPQPLPQNSDFLNAGQVTKTVTSKNWDRVDEGSSDIVKRNDIEDFNEPPF